MVYTYKELLLNYKSAYQIEKAVKDGKVYRIPKAYQSVQAKRSGLSYPSGETDVPIQPRCKTCKRRYSCNGCHWCGKCGGK